MLKILLVITHLLLITLCLIFEALEEKKCYSHHFIILHIPHLELVTIATCLNASKYKGPVCPCDTLKCKT